MRADDTRFDENLSGVNDPEIKIAVIDAEMSDIIARENFPKASIVSLSNLTSISELALNVDLGKADVTFIETAVANEYLAKNPGTLKSVTLGAPVRMFANTIMVPDNEPAFVSMINTAQQELLLFGIIDKIIDRYEVYPGSFARVAKPYTFTVE